jgi:c-di-GMP-related signal transduction protein
MHDIFLGRQPILDRNGELVAFELLFRSAPSGPANVTDGMAASASVIVNAFGELGLQRVLGDRRGFINVDADFLMSELVNLLPVGQVVLELLETVEFDDRTVARCRDLKNKGFQLALDDIVGTKRNVGPILPLVDIIKIDLLATDSESLPGLVRSFRSRPIALVAEKVDSESQAEICRQLGFDLFQGYFYARPEVLSGSRPDPAKLALLRLLALILADAELAELEPELKCQPGLTYNLMRMVNSAAAGLRTRIGTVRQAIVVMGRHQLRRWIQLLLYTVGQPNSRLQGGLLQMAATRGRLMELLAGIERPGDEDYRGRAFMTGILSLLDVLLQMPMSKVLRELNVEADVRVALLESGGALGRLFSLVQKTEEQDVAAVAALVGQLPFVTMEKLVRADTEAAGWAARIADANE